MFALPRDVHQALRSLARRPGFTALVVLTLAVGLGANATMFACLREIVFPTLGLPDEERLAYLSTATPDGSSRGTSIPDLHDYEVALEGEAELYMWRIFGATLTLGGSDEGTVFAWGEAVVPGHFELFRGIVRQGRGLLPADLRPGAERVTVIHHAFWLRRFGGDPNVVGRTLGINGRDYTIVGVTPPGFQGHGMTHQFYIPVGQLEDVSPGHLADRQSVAMTAMVRLLPGRQLAAVEARLAQVAQELDATVPLDRGARRVELRSIRQGGDYLRTEVALLMALALLLLVLACANATNLMLAGALTRRREMAVHTAIGAGRGRLLSRLLSESVLLAALGGACGLTLAVPLTRLLERYLVGGPVGTGAWGEGSRIFVVDGEVILFTLGLALGVGLVYGLAPLAQVWRLDLVSALKSGAADASPARRWGPRQGLMAAQVAVSVVLLLAAGLLVRSLLEARAQEPGFESDPLLLATLYIAPRAADASVVATRRGLYQAAIERLEALPGIETVSLTRQVPLTGWMAMTGVADPAQPEGAWRVGRLEVGEGFFATLGVPLLSGRDLEERDPGAEISPVVVNRRLADELWPGEDPLGKTLRVEQGNTQRLSVVGVVADFRHRSVVEEPQPQLYSLPTRYQRLTLLIRTAGPASVAMMESVQRTVAGLHRDVSLVDLAPFQAQIDYALQERRMVRDVALLAGLFGLALAASGIFSVMSYVVRSRRREFGIRFAVGATVGDVRRMVLRQTLALVLVGVGAGLFAAAGLTRFLASLLFGVGSQDPVVFGVVPLLVVAVATLAVLAPVARAARVDPTVVLRQD
ncbi:MAG: ADOP family duplicated permease [Acidobacteriota bacterium]